MEQPTQGQPYMTLKTVPEGTMALVFLTPTGFEIGWPEAVVTKALESPEVRKLVAHVAEKMLLSFDNAVNIARVRRSAGRN